MSKNTVKATEIKAVPFFARFLEAQAPQAEKAPIQTLKYPSDFEDY
ncbi:MAG: microviridin/marinostatin family tricyclic proteinase inhibitor [Lyngbya sp.]|nr:microviridin/marinostatin family tricyclic proteinase inhibitor [Lyngbya sp.]